MSPRSEIVEAGLTDKRVVMYIAAVLSIPFTHLEIVTDGREDSLPLQRNHE